MFAGQGITLIDALDTLLVMGMREEFTDALDMILRRNRGSGKRVLKVFPSLFFLFFFWPVSPFKNQSSKYIYVCVCVCVCVCVRLESNCRNIDIRPQ